MSLTEKERMKLTDHFWKIAVGVGCFFVLVWLLSKIPEFKEFIKFGSKDPFAIFYLIYLGIGLIVLLTPLIWLVAGLYLFLTKLYRTEQANKLYYILVIPLVSIGIVFSTFNLGKINAIRIMTGANSDQIAAISKDWTVIYDYKSAQWFKRAGFEFRPILYWAAKNELTPSSTLEYMYTLDIQSLDIALAKNNNTPDHILSDLAGRHTNYRELISKNKSASADTLRIIHQLEAQDGRYTWQVIKNLFSNPVTPKDILNDIRKKFTTEELDRILKSKSRYSFDE